MSTLHGDDLAQAEIAEELMQSMLETGRNSKKAEERESAAAWNSDRYQEHGHEEGYFNIAHNVVEKNANKNRFGKTLGGSQVAAEILESKGKNQAKKYEDYALSHGRNKKWWQFWK